MIITIDQKVEIWTRRTYELHDGITPNQIEKDVAKNPVSLEAIYESDIYQPVDDEILFDSERVLITEVFLNDQNDIKQSKEVLPDYRFIIENGEESSEKISTETPLIN